MKTRSVQEWMQERGMDFDQLLAVANLDRKILRAIVEGRYTPSPNQRQKIAKGLEVSLEEISWHHINPIAHVQGHGPQFGRSP